jgi:hypothetical protein
MLVSPFGLGAGTRCHDAPASRSVSGAGLPPIEPTVQTPQADVADTLCSCEKARGRWVTVNRQRDPFQCPMTTCVDVYPTAQALRADAAVTPVRTPVTDA